MNDQKFSTKIILILHVFLFLNSFFSISSKLAAQQEFMSLRFWLFYGVVLINMGFYAIVWQQILKKVELTIAYSNKAICMIWTILWGHIFFGEEISIWKIIGICIIIFGVIIVVSSEECDNSN